MITGPQLFWVMKVDLILTDEEARSSDGLWTGLNEEEKKEYDLKAKLICEVLGGNE